MTKKTAVLTISGLIVNLQTDDNLTLAFEGMIESTPQSLAEFININSLVKISTESQDDNERIKAAKAVAIGATLIETSPPSTIRIDMTADRIGRSMKNLVRSFRL